MTGSTYKPSQWIPTFVGISGLFLSGCLDVANMTVSIEMPGAIITKLPNVPLGVELGMSEVQIATILRNSGYLETPGTLTITSPEITKSDCGVGDPILLKTYKRNGKYDGKKVEYVFTPVFSDNIQDGKCEYQLKTLNPVEVREPSYMKEINDKN